MTSVPSQRLTVTVVICAYTDERWEAVNGAVASIRAQTRQPEQTILVVDHNQHLLDRAQRVMSGVTIVENAQARGLSGARNTGVEMARTDVVAFLDDDAIAAPDWVERLMAVYADPRVLGVGGWIEPLWEVPRPSWFPDEFGWVLSCSYRGQPEQAAPVRNLIGANMSFRRQTLLDVDGFHTEVGQVGTAMLRCDETELCIRVGQRFPAGVIVYDPAVRVRHRVTASRATWRYVRERCFTEGLAKALISRFVGHGRGLASERTYVVRTLPTGVLRELLRGALHPGSGGLGRASAIVAGFALTTAGFALGALGIISPDHSRTQPSMVSSPGSQPAR
jgi:glycosyltransferase involved in cell wall biosynthesis